MPGSITAGREHGALDLPFRSSTRGKNAGGRICMATKRGAKKAKKKAAPKKPVKKAAAKKAAAKKAAPRRAAKPSVPQVVHWEVGARDGEKQQQFFSDLFGWKVDANN